MNEKLKEKIKESLASVLPITCIVLILSVLLVPMETGTLMVFLMGAILLIIGMGFFQLGAEMSMTTLGQGVGGQLFKSRNLALIVVVSFCMGTFITIAEPDLQVLANQVASIPNRAIIWSVAVGVGIFTVIAILRILLKVRLSTLLIVFYILLFLLSFVAPDDFVAVAFDAGGVTTGPMTVPFIMALGVGLSASRTDKEGASDSFGLVALCSIGPILMVMILGIFYNPTDAVYSEALVPEVTTTRDVVTVFIKELPTYMEEVITSMLPVLAVFVIFQLIVKKYNRHQLLRMIVGFIYTILGLILFLTGVNVGFAPVGNLMGGELAGSALKWLLIPIGMLIGYYIVKAEPAVQVLNNQVEEITSGMISGKSINLCLSIGVSCAVGLAMLRVITGLNIYWIIIPGYIAALIMTKFVPSIFVGIAFDSGGVASGPMTSTFLLPLAIGSCIAVGGNVITDAFGVVALVALAPLIAIQISGIIYVVKLNKSKKTAGEPAYYDDDSIIDLEED